MRGLYYIIQFFLAGVFIFSGIIKLYPIEAFELNFIDLGVANFQTAPIIARFLIAFEVYLGLQLFAGSYLKRTYWAIIGLLVFFTGYLLIDIYLNGNEGNCGCFGTYLQMTPLQSIFKNIALLLITTLLLLFRKYNLYYLKKKWLMLSLATISLVTPFILNPPDFYFLLNYSPEFQQKAAVDVKKLPIKFSNGTIVDHTKGKSVLLFMSVTCPHCKIAAKKTELILKRNPEMPIYAIMYGDSTLMPDFEKETNAKLIHAFYNDKDFIKMVGYEVPAAFCIENGKVVDRMDKLTLTEERLKTFFSKPSN